MTSKELLAPREITSKELQVLVDEYVKNGGKITLVPPGAALNFRGSLYDEYNENQQPLKAIKKGLKSGKKKKK